MKQVLLAAAIATLLFACKKKETVTPQNGSITPPPAKTIADYGKLTVGNYWIYQMVTVDTLGNVTNNGTDSCYVRKDTVVHGNAYAVIDNSPLSIGEIMLQDSASFLLDPQENIYLTLSYFNTVLGYDSIPGTAIVIYSIPESQENVAVPLGSYTCYDYQGTVNYFSGQFKGETYYRHNYYAAGIGLIESSTFYLGNPYLTLEWRLIRAHVQ